MFALVALPVVWACTAWLQPDGDAVDIAGRTCHFNNFFWHLFSTASCTANDEHPGYGIRWRKLSEAVEEFTAGTELAPTSAGMTAELCS